MKSLSPTEQILDVLAWYALWGLTLRSRGLILAAGLDYRVGEDAIHELVLRGKLILAPDSSLRLA